MKNIYKAVFKSFIEGAFLGLVLFIVTYYIFRG